MTKPLVCIPKIILLVLLFIVTASTSFAQVVTCPITEMPFIVIANEIAAVEIDSSWTGQVVIVNPTNYIIPDMRIGVGLFSPTASDTPLYWITLPEKHTVRPSSEALVNLEVGAKHVPPGTYTLKFYVAQGDDFAPLGKSLTKHAAPAVLLKKQTINEPSITPELLLSGGDIRNTVIAPLDVTFQIQNGAPASPFRDHTLEIRVGSGVVPIGSAVQKNSETELRVLPGKTQTISLTSDATEPGTYTVAGLIKGGNELLPTVITRTTIGDTFSYYKPTMISVYGVSAYPVGESVEAFMCVAPIEAAGSTTDSYEISAQRIQLEIQAPQINVVGDRGEISTDSVGSRNALTVSLQSAAAEFTLTASLFEDRSGKESLVTKFSSTLTCDTFEVCEKITPAESVIKNIFNPVSPVIFFYIVTFLVALLIAFVALQKKSTQDKLTPPHD